MPLVIDESALGRRVVVRYRRTDPGGAPPLSDVVGELRAVDQNALTVLTGRGARTIPTSSVVTARIVAPDRGRVLDLERVAARGWRPAETIELDGWLLRANSGWTARGNSALPLATPGRPIATMLADVLDFYAARSLDALIQVPLPARGMLDAELAQRCWTIASPVVVLTKALPRGEPPAGTGAGGVPVLLESVLSPVWQAGYHVRGGQLSEAARSLLSRHENVRFASIQTGGETVAIGRAVVDEGWAGITALEVAHPHRGRGLAVGVMTALEDWAVQQGASHAYLQVTATNSAALGLYRRLGYTEHHRYHYRRAPGERGAPGASRADRNPAKSPPSITP
jgi:GNAT superfamily N-acetyltransferase